MEPLRCRGVFFFWDHCCQQWANDKFLSRNFLSNGCYQQQQPYRLCSHLHGLRLSGLGTEDGKLPQVPVPLAHYHWCSWWHPTSRSDRQCSHSGRSSGTSCLGWEILKEWVTVAQIYSQSNRTLATTTFLGVRDAIMAEYERASCPSTIAMHKISAVKHKGRSPTYTEQTHSKSAPPKASGDAPSGTPKKKTRRGGKGKTAKVHAIVSSALVPPSVTNRMQKTHHTAAPVAAPLSVLTMASTWVGGPSHAPVWVPMTIMSFKPSGVTYTKTEAPKNVQAFSGFTGQEGPHTMRKPPVAWKGMAPSKPPVSLEARMACAAIVDNAVVSSSHVTLDPSPAPLLECIATPTLAERAEFDACQKAKRKTRWGNKKAKKDLVHLAPLDPSLKGKNVIVFADAEIPNKEVSNPIDAESGKTLFIPNLQGYSHDNVRINPKHPRAWVYHGLL